MKEDVTNIILNLKQVRFKQVVEDFETEKVSITVENATELKAGDFNKQLVGFEVLNPELVICHLDPKASLRMEISINKGRGYVPADENRPFCTDVNVIPIDSIYTPIRNVKYAVENFRVEQEDRLRSLCLRLPPMVPFTRRKRSRSCPHPHPPLHVVLRREDHPREQ